MGHLYPLGVHHDTLVPHQQDIANILIPVCQYHWERKREEEGGKGRVEGREGGRRKEEEAEERRRRQKRRGEEEMVNISMHPQELVKIQVQ